VTNVERPKMLMPVAGLLFVASMYVYQKRIYRIDQNFLNFALFGVGSAFASFSYARFFMSSPVIEAGILNNFFETMGSSH
jgi:hypothetical protein